ncbi:MAG: hypothetical protein M3350_08705 [Actinomycetota bacterium]|nr:hypothetical protein [Actinomycetota bacterium]MDQ3720841.1 hypothetical protein [Actinomycetota bacterium]
MSILLLVLAIATLVSVFAFPGATIVLVPLLLVTLAVFGLSGFRTRRKQIASMQHHREKADSGGVDFTDDDRRTLSN